MPGSSGRGISSLALTIPLPSVRWWNAPCDWWSWRKWMAPLPQRRPSDSPNKLNELPRSLRLTMTYDQGRAMEKHAEIIQKPVSRSISLTHIAHGSGVPTKTPMVCRGSTCRRARTCQFTGRKNSMTSSTRTEYTAAQDTGLANAAGSLRRGAQEIRRGSEDPSIALHLELETAKVGYRRVSI
jgi:hypothetical protein